MAREPFIGQTSNLRRLLAKRGLRVVDDPRQVVAYVNHGRWVADCPECNGGIMCVPDAPGLCADCGHQYLVVWPQERTDIESLLTGRPAVNRNWLPGEPLSRLAAENKTHGVR